MRRTGIALLVGIAVVGFNAALPLSALAQILPPTATAPTGDLTIDDVQAARNSIANRTELADPLKQDILKLYDAALESLRDAAVINDRLQSFERDRASAPAELEAAKAEGALPTETRVELPPDATLDQLRQARDQADANLALAQAKVKELDDEQARRTLRRTEIPTQTAKARQDLEEVSRAIQALENQTPTNESAELLSARRVELLARQQKLNVQILSLARELANYDARAELLQIKRDQAARRVTALDKIDRAWRDAVASREKREAAEKAAAARLAAAQALPAVKDLARKNVELLEKLSGIPGGAAGLFAHRASVERESANLGSELNRLQDRFTRERRAGRGAGLSEVIDMRLRRIRAELPDLRQNRARLNARRAEAADLQQQLAEIEYDRDGLPDIETQKRVIMDKLDPSLSADVREEIGRQVDELLRKQREIYSSLVKEYNDYIELLLKVQEQENRLIVVGQEFASYIDERILWIRSMPGVSAADLTRSSQALKDMTDPELWTELGRTLWDDARANPGVFGGWIAVFLAVFVIRRRLSARLRVIAGLVPQVYTDRFSHTVNALLVTLLLAVFWPGVMWFIAWRLNNAGAASEFNKSVAAGMSRAAVILLTLQILRHLYKPNGLAEIHFRWRESTIKLLRTNVLWLTIVGVPLAFVTAMTDAQKDETSLSLGRVAFMVGMIAVSVFAARVLNLHNGVLDAALGRQRNGWLQQLRIPTFFAVVGLPLALAIAAALGYFYTAIQIERRLVTMLWLVLGLIIFNGLVLRWLMIARRRLAIEEARKRRAAQTEGAAAGTVATADGPMVLDEPKIDLNAINDQTRRLLRSAVMFGLLIGAWFIWIDMLPALGVLKKIEIFPDFGAVISAPADAFSATGPDIAPSKPSPENPVALVPGADSSAALGNSATPAPATISSNESHIVTLADVTMAVLIIVITIIVSKNIPGLLEITVLQRLPLEPSGRYAFSTIVRYVLSILGMLFAFNAIGIGWTQVQWLAAAITLGVGFGLQEIFANFISGIILLFEQPIRVGDTVTVNGMDGTVTRIRMRATTLTDYDRKEIIIPNKNFITGQIVNWTLSDSIHRLTFNIGVAYGSDTALVERTFMRIVKDYPLIMTDPAPQIVFSKFGDSSLDFSLRVFIPNLENVLRVRHEINIAIEKAFRDAGIDIAFPQRDIHIRTVPSDVSVSMADPMLARQ